MTDDIVARIRDTTSGYALRSVFAEAADEIERLRAECAELRARIADLEALAD